MTTLLTLYLYEPFPFDNMITLDIRFKKIEHIKPEPYEIKYDEIIDGNIHSTLLIGISMDRKLIDLSIHASI